MCARGQERKKAIMIADICLLKNEEYRFVCCCDLIITRCRCCYYGSSSVCVSRMTYNCHTSQQYYKNGAAHREMMRALPLYLIIKARRAYTALLAAAPASEGQRQLLFSEKQPRRESSFKRNFSAVSTFIKIMLGFDLLLYPRDSQASFHKAFKWI